MTDRIFTEIHEYWITISIHTPTGISSLDLDPTSVYSLAQYIEWLTETTPADGARRAEPNNACPDGTGVWGEFLPGSAHVASVIHIAIIGDDDDSDFGRSIALSPPVAAGLANTLIAKAVLVADVEESDDEVTE